MASNSLIDLPVGHVPGPIQAIAQACEKNEDARLAIELPGLVRRCGEATLATVRPLARLVVGGRAAPPVCLMMSPSVPDSALATAQVDALAEAIGTRHPLAVAARIEADVKVGDLIDRVFAQGEGCGCGGSGGGVIVRGTVAIGMSAKADHKLSWSRPMAAKLKLWAEDKEDGYPVQPGHSAFLGLLDCDTDWRFFPNETICYDDGCFARNRLRCQCGKRPDGKPRTRCNGLKWVCDCA
jgi:hypothetical protein